MMNTEEKEIEKAIREAVIEDIRNGNLKRNPDGTFSFTTKGKKEIERKIEDAEEYLHSKNTTY